MAHLKTTYKVIFEYDISSVEERISKYMEEGWIPTGGINWVCTYRNSDTYQYMQAIYLPVSIGKTVGIEEKNISVENTRRVRMEESFIDELDPELPPEPAPKMNHNLDEEYKEYEEYDEYEDVPF